jgi:glycosyltransferase involved in cell wall biosynthesis
MSLRVLRVAEVPRSGMAGMSGFMLNSGTEIERLGHSVSFWFREDLAPGVTSNRLRRLIVPWVIAAKVIGATIRGERYDVVEIHETMSGPYSLVARLARGALPASAALSHGLEDRFWRARLSYAKARGERIPLKTRISVPLTVLWQARLGVRTAAAVMVVSSADRDHLITTGQARAERVSAVFGGVSEELFEVERKVGPDARVLFLGSWIDRKGTHELTVAWRRLAEARAQARLTIAGVGEQDVGDLAGMPGVDVVATVTREELPDLLARHDVYVLPSWFEGMPLAMLEAAAAGLACVVTGLCGNLDMFRPEDPARDGGILIPTADPEALYAALLRLVDDGELRRQLGPRARERARLFTWRRNAERCVAAYTSAAAASGSPRSADAMQRGRALREPSEAGSADDRGDQGWG